MTIKRTTVELLKDVDDPIRKINKGVKDIPECMAEAWVTAVFEIPDVEDVRIFHGGVGGALALVTTRNDAPFHTLTQQLATSYGDGPYLFRPCHRGMFASGRSFHCGRPTPGNANPMQVKAKLADAVESKTAIMTLRELDRMERDAAREDDDTMKPQDMLALMKGLQPAPPSDDGTRTLVLEMMRQANDRAERAEERMAKMVEGIQESRGNGGLGGLLEKTVEPLLTAWIGRAFQPAAQGAASVVLPEKGFLDHLTDFGATPMGQQIGTGLANLAMRMATPSVPVMGQATATVVQPPTAMLTPGQEALPVAPPQIPPEIKAILEAFIAELGRPEEERDIEGLAAFLQGTSLGELSLWDRFEPYFRMPDRLRPLSLRLLDPRFVDDPAVAAGMAALIEYGRKLQAEPEAGA